MLRFQDLIAVTGKIKGAVIEQDMTYNPEKKNFTLGTRIMNALGVYPMSVYKTLLGDVLLVAEADGKIYRPKVQKNGTTMGRGGTFSNVQFRETMLDAFPDVTSFRLVDEDVEGVITPVWKIVADMDDDDTAVPAHAGIFEDSEETDDEHESTDRYRITDETEEVN
jgi:hypothetical protein